MPHRVLQWLKGPAAEQRFVGILKILITRVTLSYMRARVIHMLACVEHATKSITYVNIFVQLHT